MRFVFHFGEKHIWLITKTKVEFQFFFFETEQSIDTQMPFQIFCEQMLSRILRLLLNRSLEKCLRFFVGQGHWKRKKSSMLAIVHLFFPFQRFGYNTFKSLLYRKNVDLIMTWEQTGEWFCCLAQHSWLLLGDWSRIHTIFKIWSKNYSNEWAEKTVTLKWLCSNHFTSDPLKQATDTKVEIQKN